ncbi:FAD-binding oxidoreductase [Brevibacillus fluminis]|uniref:FAD-binding oxidoreductase n=1 Tax=Brevibacillus fluminis TaxID=511487 RepID=A0A3M8DJ93_9BACL|nr:FAD-binding oxidoreductase [Brevibacillus fluminis]RNB87679.1 FAD-binding oxidoreductase [Brevibacillus fluminis]
MAKHVDLLTLLSLNVETATAETADKVNEVYHALHEYIFRTDQKPTSASRAHRVLIVGGGLVGIMTAFYLYQEGYQVTVVERKSFGAAASGRNGGGVLALGRELEEIPFSRVSMDLWEQLSQHGIDTRFIRPGHAMVAMNELEAEKLGKAHALYRRAGLETVLLDPDQVSKMLPDIHPQNKGALYSPIDGQSYPFTAISSMIEWLKARGVTFIGHCEVKDFTVRNGTIAAARTDHGELYADTFILCTGPWTQFAGKLLQLHLPIIPRRSQIMVTEILEQRRVNPFVSGNGLYLRQTHAGNILYGGGGPWEVTSFDVTNTAKAIKLLSTRFIELFPGYHEKHLIRSFAGTVEITPDHLPLFGAINEFTNLYVSGGYNGHGYGMSAIMGKLLSRMIAVDHAGQELPQLIWDMIGHFSPSRFAAGQTAEPEHGVISYG